MTLCLDKEEYLNKHCKVLLSRSVQSDGEESFWKFSKHMELHASSFQAQRSACKLGGNRCKVYEKLKYFNSESVTSLIASLKAISRNLVLPIAKQYLEKDSIFSNI